MTTAILIAWLCRIERKLPFKYPRDLVEKKLKAVIEELLRRGVTFHPEKMKPMARRVWTKVAEETKALSFPPKGISSISDIDSKFAKGLTDKELQAWHNWLHEQFKKNPKAVSIEDWVNAHVALHEEMFERGLEHPSQPVDELDTRALFIVEEYPTLKGYRKVFYLKDVFEAFPDQIVIEKPPEHLYIVGGIVNRGWSETQDIDLVIKQDYPDERVMEALIKAVKGSGLGSKLHFVFTSKGPELGHYVPLYKLAFVKVGSLKEFAEALKLWSKFKPMKAKAGPGKNEFFDAKSAWEGWATKYIDRGEILQPKADGMRMQVQLEGDKIGFFTEDEFRNRASVLKKSAEELKKIAKARSFDLDAEAILFKSKPGLKVKDKEKVLEALPREDMIKIVGADEVDDQDLVFYCHDCLYLNGESLTDKPYVERLEALKKALNWAGAEHFKIMPTFEVWNLKSWNTAAKKAVYEPYSEGFMVKVADSVYLPNKRSPEWMKCKSLKELDIMVWDRKQAVNKATGRPIAHAFQYNAAILLSPEDLKKYRWDPEVVVEWKGKHYLILGWTYNFAEKRERGDILEVRTARIRTYEGKAGVRKTWMFPMVIRSRKDKSDPDYLETVEKIEKVGVKPLSEEELVVRLPECPYYKADFCPLKDQFQIEEELSRLLMEKRKLRIPCPISDHFKCVYMKDYYYALEEVLPLKGEGHEEN